MTDDIYQKLAEHLDTLPQRYPTNTGTGLETKILAHIFSPEEAAMAIKLQPMPETAAAVADRIGENPGETEAMLYDMSVKGQIMRVGRPGEYKYMAAPFLVGIIEFQLNRFSKKFVDDFEQFYPILMEHTWMKGKTRELRTIPVDRTVTDDTEVLPYESAEAIIRSNKHITVADCMCKKKNQVKGDPCKRPMEVCLQFGGLTHYFVENGLGRRIDQEEALAILKKGIDAALVPQVGSSQNPGGLCLCCSCCCGPLREYKKHDKPAQWTNSNYYAVIDEDACTACGVCETRCQMEAITIGDYSMIDLDRCIGCGLCVSTCEFDAVKMVKKPDSEQWTPQPDFFTAVMDIYKERREA